MSGLRMPGKGKAALLLSELNAEHAPQPGDIDSANEETNVTILQETNAPSGERGNEVSREAREERVPNRTGGRRNAPAKRADERTSEASQAGQGDETARRDERLARALELAAEDEITVVTVRVSARLNEYMDRYVERVNRVNPKRRYRKQDAVAESFAAFFADHPMPPAPAEDEL